MTDSARQRRATESEMSTGNTDSSEGGIGGSSDHAVASSGEVILRNGSVAIDVTDETTRLFQTVSDEEDGLGLTALRASLPPVSRPGNRAKGKPYPKELRKTVAALLIMCLNFVLTTASLSIVHEFMPEHESLPDVILNNIPYQEWALYASELTIQIQVGFAIAMCIFHKHR